MINIAYAGGERYFIKFGSFKNLQGIERNINKMPKTLRSHVNIIYKKGWYIPFAYYRKSKTGLSSKVKIYKRYFPEAHLAHGRRMFAHKVLYKFGRKIKHSEKSALQNVAISADDNTLNLPVQNYSSQNIPSILEALPQNAIKPSSKTIEEKKYKNFTKEMLSGHHYYMTYKDPKGRMNLLIKVSFGADTVTYQPILGEMKMSQANYLVENNRLYMFVDSFSNDGAYSTLDAHKKRYFEVSSWMGKKKLNTLRYYYQLNDAKKYLGIKPSVGLSAILEEGNFDEFFLKEDDY
jgi:hypothetical protein